MSDANGSLIRIRVPIFAILFLILISNSLAGTFNECNVDNLWNDWRTVAVVSMAITAGFIAALYLYGSAVDNSFIARAKNELFQLIATAMLVVFFVGMVQFMCSNIIPEAFGHADIGEGSYGIGRAYLENLTGYIQKNFGLLLSTQMFFTQLGTVNVATNLGKGLISSTKFMDEAIGLSVATNMGAYLITVTQLSLLDYIRVVSLTLLLPAGIILRGFYPFRSFGGSLIGIAIAFYVMVPLLLIVNEKMMDPVFGEQPQGIGVNSCQNDNECYSGSCVIETTVGSGSGKCAMLKSENSPPEERSCENNRECINENCVNGLCEGCGGNGENPISGKCCKGFSVNEYSGKCAIAKNINEKCTYPDHNECISGYCNPSGICELRKTSDIEECNSDIECWYGSCRRISGAEMKCAQTLLTPEDVYQVRARDQSLSTITKTDYDAKPTTANRPGEEVTILDGFFMSFIGGLIGGVMLPALNLVIISASIKSFSAFFGSEINLEKLWKII